MKDCIFPSGKKGEKCVACGWPLPIDFSEPPRRNCRSPGLGDRMATALAYFGITERRWLWLKGFVIEQPTCGCRKRRESLNRFGRWVARWRKRIAGWLKALPPAPPGE